MAEEFRQEDFDQVIKLEAVIAQALLPFAASTPTRLAIYALGRVLKALLTKCDPQTRSIYSLAILETLDGIADHRPTNPDVGKLHKFFLN
jgi:hypothetical protein